MARVQDIHAKLKLNIQKKLRKSQEKDEAVIQGLHEEIADLQRKQSELDELSQSDDHLQLLQVRQPLLTHTVSDALFSTRVWFLFPSLCIFSFYPKRKRLYH